ncbi:4-hydroxy-3-methylbut-2-enyl diphosphate reductase [Pseudonocardia xinjiangensis]|uniref:4-hydroxy-3-methylbut-2-enyl diphosphate reductase n=1 Tax=Pseudonocardia xinjiangensis TaxID=75289 RepID=A0ABX1REV0_9PSEU|nr:4-hydroxy-3-methylbut-2-enyl diphosphate reductase [Pseudonocardia xinjiangensis]NMH78931.1 4-hydroxy-3-methylbut-2-enyl diphosphate reductase [Pseudonocardia xinjiangensis]
MTTPVVCTPLRVERAAVAAPLGATEVLRTGFGPRRAATAAAALAATGPRPVLVVGVAGALDDRLRPGDLVVADEVRRDGHDPVPVPTAAPLAAALRRCGLRVHVGPVLSSPVVVDGARRAELARSGALTVDTESAWLAAGAGGGPFAVVRAVVDTPSAALYRPGTVVRGVAALRCLRRAAPALRDWLAATGPRTVELAEPRSFCAGVERAIEVVDRALVRFGAPVYVRRQIVHNAHVVRGLESRGAVFVQEVEEIPRGAVAVLAAHGVAPAVRDQARVRDLSVIDATCPLVAKVHTEVRRYSDRGNTVFLIGHSEHEEVEGTVGEAPDDVVVVEDVAAARTVQPRDAGRVAYAMQTTLAVDEAEEIADVLRGRFPGLAGPRRDDICYATTNRQRAVRAVAATADLVLVVGSPNSSNSRRLAEVAGRDGVPAHLVDDVGELDLRWLAGVHRVGVTAGASAPDHLVDDVVSCLSGLGPVTVTTATTGTESITFTLPKEVS